MTSPSKVPRSQAKVSVQLLARSGHGKAESSFLEHPKAAIMPIANAAEDKYLTLKIPGRQY